MRKARVENGIVVDVILAAEDVPGYVDCPEHIGVGATLDAPAPQHVPRSVPMSSARIILRRAGLLAAVEAALAAMPGDEGAEARIIWDTANVVERYSPLTLSLGSAIGLTAEQLDTLFQQAAEL